MENLETLTLLFSHSGILGNIPTEKLTLGNICDKNCKDKSTTESFGLFDSSSPNYTTYYPDVTPDDFKAKEDEFIYPVFRLLSAVTVHKNWNPIYFPEKILKASMNKLVGQTVYVDHESATGNALGTVQDVSWQKGYTTETGVKVPPGIIGTLKIDAKSNTRLARLITMEPPAIHSNSVTVKFSWEQSHKDMELTEFYDKLGTYDKDGNMIQKVVKDIKFYMETSLVNHGADPFAKLLDKNKNMVLSGEAKDMMALGYNISDPHTLSNLNKLYSYDYKQMEEVEVLSLCDNHKPLSNQQPLKTGNMEFLVNLATILSLSLEEGKTEWTEESLEAALVAEIADKGGNSATLSAQVASLKQSSSEKDQQIADLKAAATADQKMVKLGKDHEAFLREDSRRLHQLIIGSENLAEDDPMAKLINSADSLTLKTLHDNFVTQADGQFTHTCQACGSTDISLASATPSGGHEDDQKKPEVVNNAESRKDKLARKHRNKK